MVEPGAPRKPLLPPHLLKPLGLAFGVGLLLFLLLWLDQRNDTDFFRGGDAEAPQGATDALPAPLPADVAIEGGNASGLPVPAAARPTPARVPDQARIIDEPPPAPPAPAAPRPAPSVADVDARGGDTPVPLSRPAPRYPREALRDNAGGTVRVRVTVGTDGSVERLQVETGSGNRHLDRAATEAVRRWRFQPAVRNGQPVPADVVVPIVFNAGG